MAKNHLDMSLEQIIHKNKNHRKPNRGRTSGGSVVGGGPDRRVKHFHPYSMRMPHVRQEPVFMLIPVQGFGGSSGTKLYVSNLDSGVSNGDIKLLFSEVGELMRYSVHYDKSGRSKGTAEVEYARHADAVAAIKRYNNNNLDGKPMKIDIVGTNTLVYNPISSAPGSNISNSTFNYGSDQQSTGVRAHPGFGASTMDRGGGTGHFRGQRQQKQNVKKATAEELNADLEKYRAQAKSSK